MGGVYVNKLAGADTFKVGFSKSPDQRRKGLGTGNPGQWEPFAVIETEYRSKCETDLKGLLLPYKRRGIDADEIYDVDPELMLAHVESARRYADGALPHLAEAEKLKRQKTDDRVISPGDVEREAVARLREIKAEKHVLEREERQLQAMLMVGIGTTSGIDALVRWESRSKTDFNRPLFVEQQRVMFESYQHTIIYRPWSLL
jgi:hypothetical protein